MQSAFILASLVLLSSITHAATKCLSSSLVQEAANAAIQKCASNGYLVTATVVDSAGLVIAAIRTDGAAPHTIDASRRKAYASAKNSTSAMLATSQSNPAAQNLGQIDGFLLLAGGVPISSGGVVVGAIGVGGAPGGPLDEECALAGIEKIKDRLN